ncbi:MAG: formylglycine-generating enzyme family protein [Marinilabiliales bacterium]|nr:formylglycine-generating enzyme family protein [Marinilabiliales bacterium]
MKKRWGNWPKDGRTGLICFGLLTAVWGCVRSEAVTTTDDVTPPTVTLAEAQIPAGTFDMGDHFGFVDPSHPSDELPIHQVTLSAFRISKLEITNRQFLDFLNSSLKKGAIKVQNQTVLPSGGGEIYCYTHQYADYYSIGYDGVQFSIADFRADHPVVGVSWCGAAAYCNWLSESNGLNVCYHPDSWICDFTKNGYRLPTEAEWEYAARGGHTDPYLNYPNGNSIDKSAVNLPESGDPYETGPYPQTTPVGFYDGQLKLKSVFNWPGSAPSYQTADGKNGYGLYDMQGNVWEYVNDWYGQDYYAKSPKENPRGPDTGFLMPDGKPYRGMRGGNWYNGLVTGGVNDGHSRVSNRNPTYYRGPQDPNHPYYHLGFRVARN